MVQNLWTTGFFHASPPPYHLVKICLLYSHWCFWPFPLPIQFHALLFVLIAVFHKNTPNTGCPVLGYISVLGQFFFVRQLLHFICCAPCACRQFRSALFLPCERAFLPAAFVARLSRECRSFCRKVVLCPGKSTGRLLRPFIPPFLTDFTMFFAKKALQMNFKNILYNYRFNFFTQIVSYRFVWGSRVCAFCTASALR